MASTAVAAAGGVVLVVLVALSAFFSSSETAIFTLSEAWLAEQGDDDRSTALRKLRGDPHRLLVTILVGNNVVNVAIASITTALLLTVLPAGSAVTAATVAVSLVVLVFGEIVPKSYGLGHAETWALRVARPVSLIGRVLSPVTVVFDVVTRRLTKLVGGDVDIEQPYVEA